MILDAGATFYGAVVATDSAAANTLELTAKDGAGTLGGIGNIFVGFQTVTIDTGAV